MYSNIRSLLAVFLTVYAIQTPTKKLSKDKPIALVVKAKAR